MGSLMIVLFEKKKRFQSIDSSIVEVYSIAVCNDNVLKSFAMLALKNLCP